MEQKVKLGGTPMRAPIGYLNVRVMRNGSESREVQLDPARAELIRWAFETYTTQPDITVTRLVEMLRDRGLTTRPTPTQPARPIGASQLYKTLVNRYYVGVVTWRGVEYPGSHEPLISEEIFNRVQARMEANRAGANHERKHLNYLRGSLFCARCGARLTYSLAHGHGGLYEYYVCSSRHADRSLCDGNFVQLDRIEDAVERLWDAERQHWRDLVLPEVQAELMKQLDAIRADANLGTDDLKRRITKLNDERYKWAEHVMDGTVPADVARDKQTQLAQQIATLEAELATMERAGIDTTATLNRLLDLLADPARLYAASSDEHRRMLNQVWFERILIDTYDVVPGRPVLVDAEHTPLAKAITGLMPANRGSSPETPENETADSCESAVQMTNRVVDVVVPLRRLWWTSW